MKLFRQFFNSFFSSTHEPIDDVVCKKDVGPRNDKVGNFNKMAPHLFAPRLKDLGYELRKIEDFHYCGFLWSTHHFYVNDQLNLTVDIQQAPYYTDYGFSIFLFHTDLQDLKLLCNVPHELQDKDDKFLTGMIDKFFSDLEIISLLKGETWKTINFLRSE